MPDDDPTFHKDVDYEVYEHGHNWSVYRHCGAQWANYGKDDFEFVKQGDGSCLEEETECQE